MIRPRLLLTLSAGALAFAGTLVITEPLGPGLDPDGMAYVHAGASLAHRGKLLDVRDGWVSADSERALTRWPPGFSIAIAAPVAAGAPPVQSARFVMALSAFAAMAILVWLVSGAASLLAGALLALLLLVTPAVVYVHLSLLSEPLFLATLAATLALMVRERASPLAAGTAAAAASMVRYAGLGAVGAVVLWELARAGRLPARIRRAAISAAPALIVNAWWWIRAAAVGGRGAVRDFSVYGEIGTTMREGIETSIAWLAPGVTSEAPWAASAIAVGIVVTMVIGFRRAVSGTRLAGQRLLGAATLLTICYLGLVLVARIVADPEIPLDERILAPAFVGATLIAVVTGASWWQIATQPGRAIAVVALAVWGTASLLVSRGYAHYAVDTGSDYADICWRGSPVTAWVREHGVGHPLVSNGQVALYFHARRLSREMPTDLPSDSIRAFADTIAARKAYVVLFDRSCAVTVDQPDELIASLGLVREAQLATGSIWRAGPPPASLLAPPKHEPPAAKRPPAVRATP